MKNKQELARIRNWNIAQLSSVVKDSRLIKIIPDDIAECLGLKALEELQSLLLKLEHCMMKVKKIKYLCADCTDITNKKPSKKAGLWECDCCRSQPYNSNFDLELYRYVENPQEDTVKEYLESGAQIND